MAGPIDWIFQFMRRPRSVITKSQYIERARGLAQRAKEIKAMGDMLKRQDRGGGRDRAWRNNLKRVQREVLQLEEDHQALDAVFPQVRVFWVCVCVFWRGCRAALRAVLRCAARVCVFAASLPTL